MKKSRGLFNSGWQDELYFRLILAKWTEIGSLWIRTVDKYPTECIVYWTILNRPSQTDLTFHQGQLASSTSSFHFKKHQTVPGALHVYNSMSDQSKHRTGSIGSEGCIKRGPGLLKFFFFLLKWQRRYWVSFINDVDRFEVTRECIKKWKPLYGLH